jgi:hypothetical protein
MLFQTTEELKQYIPVDAALNWATVKMYVGEAEQLFVKDLLGEAMYDTLHTDYSANAGAPVDANNAALLPYVQRCLAYYTMFLGIDHLNVNVGDAGTTQHRADNSEPAPKWKIDALKVNYIKSGDLHAQKLLEFLEKNASPTKFNDWYSSSANTIAEGLLVPTITVAEQYVDISDRRLFRRMKKKIREIEMNLVKKLIGADQYDQLVTEIKADSLKDNAEDTALVEKLRPIIARKALYEVIPFLKLSVTADGITIMSSNDSTISKSAAGKEDIQALRQSLSSDFTSDIEELKQFVIDNITDYPLIEESTAYTSRPDPGPKRPPVNSKNNKYFSV